MKLLNSIKKFFNNKDEVTSKINNPIQWEYHFNPQKSKYHDYEESYFKQPKSGKIIKLAARDALSLISFHEEGWSHQKLYNELKNGFTNNNITVEDIQLFLDEYNKGNMNQAISFICDNTIEYNYSDKEDYLK